MMVAALISVIGSLVGVALGGVLAYLFGKRSQTSLSLHEARIAAFARFSNAAMEYRRTLMDRWFVQHEPGATTDSDSVYASRSAAWAALYEVRLLARADATSRDAQAVIDLASQIKNATDRAELVRLADATRDAVDTFVQTARAEVDARS